MSRYLPILELSQGSNTNGGIAMGVMFTLAPIVAIFGAIAGVMLALKLSKSPSVNNSSSSTNAASDIDQLEESTNQNESTNNRGQFHSLIAFGVIGAIVAGLYFFLLREEPPPPQFSQHRPKPVLLFEIQAPTNTIVEEYDFKVRGELRSWYHSFAPDYRIERTSEGDITTLSGEVTMWNKVDNRAFHLWLSMHSFFEFKLPIAASPTAEPEFSDWRHVDKIEIHRPDMVIPKPEDIKIRTRVVWPDGG